MSTQDRFSAAIAAFDAYHRTDPNTETANGEVIPSELLYAQRMTDRLKSFAPDANEAVKLAARCQHIGRWEIRRDAYPMDRKGYLQWRNEAKRHHAAIAERILREAGYDSDTIETVKRLLLKKELFTNPDTQLLEDIACLVFLEYYAEPFAAKHDNEKVVDILVKTMKKMSDTAKQSVNQIALPSNVQSLIARATERI